MPRVVAGAVGGRSLRVPRGRGTRPTSDRVREALFSTLAARVVGAAVLDLYAGSGALGIEALSRGAARATFVEHDRRSAAVLRSNLVALGFEAVVHTMDVARFAREVGMIGDGPYDLVLCDPPYGLPSPAVAAQLEALAGQRCLATDAMMVVERARHGGAFSVAEELFQAEDVRTYGDTVLYYLTARTTSHEERDQDR